MNSKTGNILYKAGYNVKVICDLIIHEGNKEKNKHTTLRYEDLKDSANLSTKNLSFMDFRNFNFGSLNLESVD